MPGTVANSNVKSTANCTNAFCSVMIRNPAFYESDLEGAIISHITEFLLELGKGFSFVARQKRIMLEDDEFFIDLVLYNRLLRCFVIIEIKTGKITH